MNSKLVAKPIGKSWKLVVQSSKEIFLQILTIHPYTILREG